MYFLLSSDGAFILSNIFNDKKVFQSEVFFFHIDSSFDGIINMYSILNGQKDNEELL